MVLLMKAIKKYLGMLDIFRDADIYITMVTLYPYEMM